MKWRLAKDDRRAALLPGLLWFALVCPLQAQIYAVDWFTLDGGGGTSAGGAYSLSGTIGQPDAGEMSGGTFSLVGGFWSVTQTPESPVLAITNSGGAVIVSWPTAADNFVLDQAGTLGLPPAGPAWAPVPPVLYQTNATHIFITVPMPAGNQFYRLRKP